MESLRGKNRLSVATAALVAGSLLVAGCGGNSSPKPEDAHKSVDSTPYIDGNQTHSDWRITSVDKVGHTDFHHELGYESDVYFIEYTDKDGNTLLCQEERPYRWDAGPAVTCNWDEYNQGAGISAPAG